MIDWYLIGNFLIALLLVELVKHIFSLALELLSTAEDYGFTEVKIKSKRKGRRGFRYYRGTSGERIGAETTSFRTWIRKGV